MIRSELELTCCGEDMEMETYVEETNKVVAKDAVMVSVRGERGVTIALDDFLSLRRIFLSR